MKLSNVINTLESRIAQLEGEPLFALYLQLCEHLVLVSNYKLSQYSNLILLDESLPVRHLYKLKAMLFKASMLMNQLNIAEARAMLESMEADVLAAKDIELLVDWQRQYALAMVYNGKAAVGIQLIEECITNAKKAANDTMLCYVYSFAAICYYERDLVKAGEYAMQSLSYAQQSNKGWMVGYATLMLGYWARENKMEEKTLLNFAGAVEILKSEGADEYYANSLMQLAIAYKDKGEFDKAIALLHVALPLLEQLHNARLLIIANYSIGRCYRSMKRYVDAERYYLSALSEAAAIGNTYEMAVCNVFLGHLYRDMEKPELAIAHLEKAIEQFGDNLRPSTKADLYKHMHPLYLKTGKVRKAYDTLLAYTDIRFKLQDENRIKEAAQLQEKYEAEKKEAELQKTKLQHTESELKALKAQMNPHFIFNSLNSIQEVFFTGDKRLANEHLSRFSQLMRNILKASSKHSISLHEEINMLKEYMDLEALRLGSSFTYNIVCDSTVDMYTMELPPMVLQPFIENSIKHGLQHKEGSKRIDMSFSFNEDDEVLSCLIQDNGIGRKASEAINKKRLGHQSFATTATTRRFEMLNQNSEQPFLYTYTDIVDAEGNALGTAVSINIPSIFQ